MQTYATLRKNSLKDNYINVLFCFILRKKGEEKKYNSIFLSKSRKYLVVTSI